MWTGVDVTGAMSMIILPENVLMIPQSEIPIVTQYYPRTLHPRYTGVEPDIWLGLVSNGSEAYPMLMGGGSSTRYEGMKQRGTSIFKTFIIYSIFSYIQHGRIHHIKHRWSLALTLVLTTLTTPLCPQ